MAENDTPEAMQDVQEEHKTSTGDSSENNSINEAQALTGSSTILSRGSKVSNLRAAFEQSGSNGPARSSSADRRIASAARTGSGFEAELSRLKDVLAKEQDQKDAEKRRMEAMQAEIEQLKQQLEIQQAGGAENNNVESEEEQDEEESERANGHHSDSEALAYELHNAKAEAQAYADELVQVRLQLGEMKRSIATNTRIESHEMTDSVFQGEFGTLCYLIQDWVINTYRKTKIEKSIEGMCATIDTLDVKQHHLLRLLFEQWDNSSKLVILQSAVSCLILPIFQDPMPFGLPSSLTWSEAVRLASEELQGVLDSTAYNRWRATTFDIICHSEAISPFVHSAANRITDNICATIDQICNTTTLEAQTDALRNVVRRVIALSHSLRIQRAAYDIRLPAPGSAYDANEMEGVSGDHDDDDAPDDRTIQCAVFPAVHKIASTGSSALIFRARVSWKESWD